MATRRESVSRTGCVQGPFAYADGGTWHRILWWQGGARRSESVPGDRRTADRRLLKRLQEAEEERVGLRLPERPVAPTLAEVTLRAEREYLVRRQGPRQVERTLALMVRWWAPLGDRPVDRIAVADVGAVLARIRAQGRSAATANRALAALSSVLEGAVEWGLIATNPARGPRLRQREAAKVPRVLTGEEAARLVRSCSPLWRDFFAAALYTGLRLSELTGLRWGQVDLAGRAIRLIGKGGRARTVPLWPALAELLPPQGQPEALVFPRRDERTGEVSTGNLPIVSPQKALAAALRAAGIQRHLSMHDLRHTFASLYMRQTSDLVGLSRILGHGSVTTTARYVHHLGWTGDARPFELG